MGARRSLLLSVFEAALGAALLCVAFAVASFAGSTDEGFAFAEDAEEEKPFRFVTAVRTAAPSYLVGSCRFCVAPRFLSPSLRRQGEGCALFV